MRTVGQFVSSQGYIVLADCGFCGLADIHETALRGDEDRDRLSYVHAVRVIRRKPAVFAALAASG